MIQKKRIEGEGGLTYIAKGRWIGYISGGDVAGKSIKKGVCFGGVKRGIEESQRQRQRRRDDRGRGIEG